MSDDPIMEKYICIYLNDKNEIIREFFDKEDLPEMCNKVSAINSRYENKIRALTFYIKNEDDLHFANVGAVEFLHSHGVKIQDTKTKFAVLMAIFFISIYIFCFMQIVFPLLS